MKRTLSLVYGGSAVFDGGFAVGFSVGYILAMRVHVVLEDEVIEELWRKVPPRGRSAFIGAAVKRALQEKARWENLEAVLGVLRSGHSWDEDPAAWTRAQRRGDKRRVG